MVDPAEGFHVTEAFGRCAFLPVSLFVGIVETRRD